MTKTRKAFLAQILVMISVCLLISRNGCQNIQRGVFPLGILILLEVAMALTENELNKSMNRSHRRDLGQAMFPVAMYQFLFGNERHILYFLFALMLFFVWEFIAISRFLQWARKRIRMRRIMDAEKEWSEYDPVEEECEKEESSVFSSLVFFILFGIDHAASRFVVCTMVPTLCSLFF